MSTTNPNTSVWRPSRRGILAAFAGAGFDRVIRSATASSAEAAAERIPALVPREPSGHQFLLYSDCCSGIPGGPFAARHASVNAMVRRIRPRPEFIAFPGDAISGYIKDGNALRAQWDYWHDTEMRWMAGTGIRLFPSTSNHNTYDPGSEKVFREVHAALPQNGPAGQEGLAYAIRHGNLLYVSTHQPDRLRPYRRDMVFEPEWLDAVLTRNADAAFKFVAGHYPVHPVNGYEQYPLWLFRPEERRPFWDVLVKHGVDAYLTSHIIAFDVQVHDGVLQILSGGAGTAYGPGGMMPGRTEYLHAIQLAIDEQGLRYQVLDTTGTVRESLSWPFTLPAADTWHPLTSENARAAMTSRTESMPITAWRLRGRLGDAGPDGSTQTMLCGCDPPDGVPAVWIGFEGRPARLAVRLLPQPGFGSQSWTGPAFETGTDFDFQIALHPGMGPGGVLFRPHGTEPWTSLDSTSSKGAEDLKWPGSWTVGNRYSGPTDLPFRGAKLHISFVRRPVPAT